MFNEKDLKYSMWIGIALIMFIVLGWVAHLPDPV